MLFGLGAAARQGRGGAVRVALEPVEVTQDALVASFPAQVPGGGQCGGEVAGEACGLGQAAAGGGGEAAAAVGDLLVAAA